MSLATDRFNIPRLCVAYVPTHARANQGAPSYSDLKHPDVERGKVSSVNERFVFVRFDHTVAKLGWEGTTSQSCKPDDLLIMEDR